MKDHHSTPLLVFASCMLVVMLCIIGCAGTRAIYVDPTTPVRLAKDTPAEVWVRDAQGVETLVRLTLREGQWVLTRTPKAEPVKP